jgi:V-type H+-transporting ATPase subunit D
MSNQNRYVVAPTITMLTAMKARLIGATKGHALLKKKADALSMRFRQILKEIIDSKQGLGDKMKGSFFAYTEARYAAGENVKHTILDNVDRATIKVLSSLDNVAGVKIPKFEQVSEAGETKNDLTGARPCQPSACSTLLSIHGKVVSAGTPHHCPLRCCYAAMSPIQR